MTLDGHDTGGDETPAPPARTRWQEDLPEDDDDLLPPFVPGHNRSDAPPAPAVAPAAESAASAANDGPEMAAPEPEPASPTVEPEAAANLDSSPFDFPWESGAEAEPASPDEAAESAGGWQPGPTPAQDDEFPFDAFDIEGDEAGAEFAAPSQPPTPASPDMDREELASRVERLAGVLRTEGRTGVEREMASDDRLVSLLAGVLAGYLAGLED